VRLTIVGSSASYASAGHACSGYLVEGGSARVLFDCGNGCLANLGRVLDPADLDAVFISHAHPDHFVDLYALQALLRYAPTGPVAPLPLYLPSGLYARMRCLLSGRGAQELDEAFQVNELADGVPVQIADLRVVPIRVEHTEPTFALRAEADGTTIAYTADSSPGGWLLKALSGASVAIAEATLPARFAGAAPHLTAEQAGSFAQAAGVERLVLTHVWPTNDLDATLAEASAAFGDEVHLAREFDTFDVPERSAL